MSRKNFSFGLFDNLPRNLKVSDTAKSKGKYYAYVMYDAAYNMAVFYEKKFQKCEDHVHFYLRAVHSYISIDILYIYT